jgi:SAM-dependent MidA family methyltransferase
MKPPPEQASSPESPGPAGREYLRAQAGAGGILSYRDFTAAALYAPGWGDYARAGARRVGRDRRADFYTAASLGGGIFGQLLRVAAAALLAPENPADYTLIELGAEPGVGVFGDEAAPFARVETRRLGDPLGFPACAVIFANELLDAQPFHRFVFRRGAWRELGVQVDGPELEELELPEFSPAARAAAAILPADASEEQHLDWSLDAEALARALASALERGLLIFADYGYDWRELTQERPAGTARAYRGHAASRDLLAHPGEQDLTCHVCWDRIERALREGGCGETQVERQEAFFARHAGLAIASLLARDAERFSPARQTLLELLHPAHLGGIFQILWARRP